MQQVVSPIKCKQTKIFDTELFPWMAQNLVKSEGQLDLPGERETQCQSVAKLTVDNEQWLRIIQLVQFSGKYNKDDCCIQVNHLWNFELLESLLYEYHDKERVDLLKFGWPIERDGSHPLEMSGVNHKGATMYPEHVDRYLQKEIALGACIGPFDHKPFSTQVAISPISTRAKKDSEERCIIMDCSWPIGMSLNDGISKVDYLGAP